MKFIISVVILVFMVGLPLSTLKHNYYVFKTLNEGVNLENNIIKKSENGYSNRTNYYVFVERDGKQIEIRVPYNVCNKKQIGDSIKYKYIYGSDFGVFVGGLHPFNFIFNVLILIIGIFFLYYILMKNK